MQLREGIVEDCGDDEAARVQPVGLLHNVSQRAQIVTASDSDLVAVVHVVLRDAVWEEVEVLGLLLLGDWERQRHHGVEGDGHTITLRATHRALELTMEQICHDGLIALQVLVPSLFGSLNLRLVRLLVHLDVRLLTLSVEIFAH